MLDQHGGITIHLHLFAGNLSSCLTHSMCSPAAKARPTSRGDHCSNNDQTDGGLLVDVHRRRFLGLGFLLQSAASRWSASRQHDDILFDDWVDTFHGVYAKTKFSGSGITQVEGYGSRPRDRHQPVRGWCCTVTSTSRSRDWPDLRSPASPRELRTAQQPVR